MERNDAVLEAPLPRESRFLDSHRSLGMTRGLRSLGVTTGLRSPGLISMVEPAITPARI